MSRSRGAVLVETALMIPILLLLSLGMIEFGFYFFVQHQLQGAAREGARVGIVMNAETEDVESAVARALGFESIDGTPFQLAVDEEVVESGEEEIRPISGVHLRVVVSARWDQVGVRPLRLIAADRQVRGRAVMRVEEGVSDGGDE